MASTSKSHSFSPSSMSRRNYGVFLSFRGPDCRHTIISHLYNALTQKGVYVFKDNEELEEGQRRSELFDAIEGSQIAVVVFSENYAGSKWCLDELQKIMECKEQGKLTVLPIFYHVSPREVRLHAKDNGKKGRYQKAMEEMDVMYEKDSETVKRWRKALWKGGDLIGIPLDRGQDEGNFVREVVEKVLKQLNRVPLEVAKYPVGIGRHLKAIRPLLQLDPHINDVCMVGLLGQGGAGKTTLSKAICNDISDSFDSWCFLPNVRETTSRVFNGLVHLQQTFLRELLSEEKLMVSSVDAGKKLIKERLRNKRVLVILDDVDESNQLDALAGDFNWFGRGSRIIITTRNKHVLTSNGLPVYEVKLLEKEEADNLFRLHAFGEMKERNDIDGGLINSFVEYAGQLPLALVVLGAFLRGRSRSEWEGKRKELAKSPDTNINLVLKISFKGLEESHKEMFLDVACFYKGWNVGIVEKILDSCGFTSSLGMAILIERCLITVVHQKIQMHDLLEAMGWSIVHDEYSRGNGMLSRIWMYKDFLDILTKDGEKQAVKGIVLNHSWQHYGGLVKPNALKGFKKLRVLIIRDFFHTEELVQLPGELRWLEWWGCSASAIEFDPSSKIVGLDLQRSKIRQIKGTRFEELKYLDLFLCDFLKTLPDLSNCWKLEDLDLSLCKSLIGLDEAIGSLENLVNLNLHYCGKLMTVPSSFRSKHLQTLSLQCCFKQEKLPAIQDELLFLENLDLSETAVKELPDSIGNLVALKKLHLRRCKELTTIPSSMYRMRALQVLDLGYCPKLSTFPRRTGVFGFPNLVSLKISDCMLKDIEFLNDLTCLETLMSLDLSGNEFTHLPASISNFKNLEVLSLRCCDRLVEVSELPNVLYLTADDCRRLKTFPCLYTFICRSPKLFRVDLSDCHSLDHGYMDRSLPLEHVRGFVGAANVIFPGEEFPHWVNFQNKECSSRYYVSLPPNMSKDDPLGLALFISFGSAPFIPQLPELLNNGTVDVRVDGVPLLKNIYYTVGVHSWFFYIPRQSLFQQESRFATMSNRRDITFEFSAERVKLRRWGMRLLCKREQDDHQIKVSKDEDNEGDSSGSEHESVIACIYDSDYDSALSEW